MINNNLELCCDQNIFKFYMTITTTIEQLTRKLFNLSFYQNDADNNEINDIISQIFSELYNVKKIDQFLLSEHQINKIRTIFMSLKKMLTTSIKLLTIEKKTQLMIDIKILDYFDYFEKHNIHRIEKNGILYKCEYHSEDLFTHLHLACLTSLAFMIKNNISDNELIKCATIAYLHDIGKAGSLSCIDGKKWTSYTFHGELGSGLLLQMWTEQFGEPYTKEIWEEICRTIAIHMCGYHQHDHEDKDTQYKWSILTSETLNVKRNLYYLSFGDHFGGIPEDTVEKVSDTIYINSREQFINMINNSLPPKAFYEMNNLNGLVIFVRGRSASGKSTCGKMIQNMMSERNIKCRIVERDRIICSISAKSLGEIIYDRPIGDNYRKYYDNYKKNKDKLSKEVADKMKTEINDGIINGEIVIVDTVMTYFNAINFSVPDTIRKCFIVSIDVIRNTIITEKDSYRLGCNLSSQLDLFGERDMFSWLKEDKGNYRNLSSYSTARSFMRNICITRPRLCFVTAWNENGTFGINEMMRQLKYLSTPFINNEITRQNDDDIISYCNNLYRQSSWETMVNTIKMQAYMASCPPQLKNTSYENRIIKIKYLDHNKQWKPKWTRQSRGIVMFLNDDNKIVPLRFLLQKGAEMLTGLHIKAGINETESYDVNDNLPEKLQTFDNIQQDTMKKLLSNSPIDAYMSSKCDGSLLGITFYFGEYGQKIKSIVKNNCDEFANICMCMFEKMDCVGVISSQGTLFLGSDMQGYMITSLLVGSGIMSDDDIKKMAKTKSYNQVFQENGFLTLSYSKQIMNKIKLNRSKLISITLSFEAICKYRTSAWNDIHPELAVSYNRSSCKFLGMSACYEDNILYLPHFALSCLTEYVNTCFKEPLWWKVNHTEQINDMINDLEECIKNKMTTIDYLTKHRPNNYCHDGENESLDYEGFVFFVPNKIKDMIEYDYGKIKSRIYYITHKYSPKNGNELMSLPETADEIFPLVGKIRSFYNSLDIKILKSIESFMNELRKDKNENKLYDGLPNKAKLSFDKQNETIKKRMLINASESFGDIIYNIFAKNFPEITNTVSDKIDVIRTIKKIVINENITNNSEEINELFGYCINSGFIE